MHAGLGGLLILTIDLITEQGPAISLAYEPAEALVMDRPPRDLTRDRLVNGPLLRYAYLIAGIMTVSRHRGLCMTSWSCVQCSAHSTCWHAQAPVVCGCCCMERCHLHLMKTV